MSQEIQNEDDKLLIKEGLYNFTEAEDYGFELDEYLNGAFETIFIKQTLLEDFMLFRDSFIQKNYSQVKFYAHKMKGTFNIICSHKISNDFKEIQSIITNGGTDIDDYYVDACLLMVEFFDSLVEFCKLKNKPIKDELIVKIKNKLEDYDKKESDNIKSKFKLKKNGVEVEHKSDNICCTSMIECYIF